MKFVIQRVNNASVTIDEKIVGKINKGFLVFIGVSNDDTKEIADKMIKKLIGMRIFDDENGNLSADKSEDNTHLYAKYYEVWGKWIVSQSASLTKEELH